MYTNDEDISSLICSRICHDLVSPLGAIQNGIELLELSGAPHSPELEIIAQSAKNANARLSFLRIAFGDAPAGSLLPEAQITTVVSANYVGKRQAIDWQVQGDQPREQVKLIFLLLMCFESALAYGGNILVRKADNNWAISATAERANFDSPQWKALVENDGFQPASSEIHFEVARRIFDTQNITPDWSLCNDVKRVMFNTSTMG